VQNPDLSATIARHLREQAELHVSVRVQHDHVILEGRVSSPEAWQAAEDLAAQVAPGYRIENHLEIEDLRPEEVRHMRTATADDLRAVEPDIFRFAPTPPEPEHASANDADLDPGTGESGEPFTPPMDPPLDRDAQGNPRMLGGFGHSALDDVSVDESASDPILGDEALAEAIRRELREDAATTALNIDVEVRDGVAHLSGVVAGPEDAEAAEAVAARVPGLAEIADDLVIQSSTPRGSRSTGQDRL
jgi:osmotically-inducible protein OsmY